MNQKDMIISLSEKLEIDQKSAGNFIDAFKELVVENIHQEVKLTGFGIFSLKERTARKGRHPSTGKEIDIAAKMVPVFKASSSLKDIVQK